MIQDIKSSCQQRMEKTIEALEHSFGKIRTGRANPAMLKDVMVSYYGTDTPLQQVASINVEDARTLLVQPYERTMVAVIDKALRMSDLGLNPITADVIRVPLPALTEETRRDMQKIARHDAESARVSVRNVRRDAMADLKELLKEKEISEDEERKASEEIQKITDRFIAEVDKQLAAKESDLMRV